MINSKRYPGEFSGELLAGRYLLFAGRAEKEGYPHIARLFRATAQAETVDPAAHEGHKRISRTPLFVEYPGAAHVSPYLKALGSLAEKGKGDYNVCSKCGYINKRQRPEKCPRCRSEALTLVKVG